MKIDEFIERLEALKGGDISGETMVVFDMITAFIEINDIQSDHLPDGKLVVAIRHPFH